MYAGKTLVSSYDVLLTLSCCAAAICTVGSCLCACNTIQRSDESCVPFSNLPRVCRSDKTKYFDECGLVKEKPSSVSILLALIFVSSQLSAQLLEVPNGLLDLQLAVILCTEPGVVPFL